MPPKSVLLVDSHEDSRAIYTAILKHYGFEVAAAAHPDEGLRMARARRPDLIVLEFSPPRARSLEAFRAFRCDDATASVPIVALSTMLGEADRELLASEGIAVYLVKPCPPLTLLDAAKRLLEGP